MTDPTEPGLLGWAEVDSLRREIEFRASVNRERIDSVERQVAQATAAAKDFGAAERTALQAQLDGIRREIAMMIDAQKEAVLKQEAATSRRFDGINEWRGQSADRERSMQEQTLLLTSSFMPREVADATFDALRKDLAVIRDRLSISSGQEQGREATITSRRLDVAQVINLLVLTVLALGVVATLLVH